MTVDYSEKANMTIDLSGPFVAPSRSDIGKKSLGDERLISNHHDPCISYVSDYYKSVFGWIPANPSKVDLVEAIKSVFVFTDKEGTDPNNYINTDEGNNNFRVQIVKNQQIQTFFLIAPKGAGKTFYLNYFVNTQNDYLYKNNKIWYRAELTKLYKHNISLSKSQHHESLENLRSYTLVEYLNLHIVYVTFKYRSNNPIFENIWSDKDGKFTDLIIERWYADDVFRTQIQSEPDELIKEFTSFIEKAKIYEKHGDTKRLIKDDIKKLLHSKDKVIEANLMAEAIVTYLHNNDFQPIFIIDGLDNIDYFDSSQYYNDFLEQVRGFCLKDDKSNKYFSRVLISIRDETFEHLRVANQHFFNNFNPLIFRIKPHDISKIINHKTSVAIRPTCNFFKNNHKDTIAKIQEYYSSQQAKNKPADYEDFIHSHNDTFSNFKETFFSKLLDAIHSIIPADKRPHKIDAAFLFKYFYGNNLRSFIHNYLNIYEYHKFLTEKKPHIKEDRAYIFTEGQLLNGGLFLDTENLPFEFGKCLPNIFYFDSSKPLKKWHGLCLFRILQQLTNRAVEKDELTGTIKTDFQYDLNVIDQCFFYGLAQGLVNCRYDKKNNSLLSSITKKGILLSEYFFFDINLFYYIALDTPLSSGAISNSKLIKIHSNKPSYWENYIESCILTSLTFIRHIKTADAEETKSLSEEKKRIYSLPHVFPDMLLKGMGSFINHLKGINKHRYDMLIANIEGIV